MAKKFEVTEFNTNRLAASYFVKLHSERFTVPELAAIRVLRHAVNKKYPQRKGMKVVPTKWRLVVGSHGPDGNMVGQLFIELPEGRRIEWEYFGTVESVCADLGNSLAANP